MADRKNPSAWIVIIGAFWGMTLLVLGAVSEPTRHNTAMTASIALSGIYTLGWYVTRRHWLPCCRSAPRFYAAAIGILNAAVVETLFLAVGVSLGAPEIAAAPDLLIDLAVTMPWYAGMVTLFVIGQSRSRYSLWSVLLLGALYETGGDGLIGGLLVPLLNGGANIPLLCLWIPAVAFWQFIPVYSSMVLPPALILADTDTPPLPPGSLPRWGWAALPLLWLIPYAICTAGLTLMISAL
jgi:hypothetical protein